MSLTDLMRTGLPLSRQERFYTHTVLPMIVCAHDFRELGVLTRLIPGCELPHIDANPYTTNIQFFTEYSLVDSIAGRRTETRFPDPPNTEVQPKLMILATGDRTVLVAIAALFYHQPPLETLVRRLQSQRVQLDYLREQLQIDSVHHAALLPAAYATTIGSTAIDLDEDDCPIITWEGLLAAYRRMRSGDDYFMAVLDLALERREQSHPLLPIDDLEW
ncbi:MAG: hypothetical protein ACOX8V_06300 [Thermoleophilia bacterium]|jgi:hypothetical protein